MEEKKFESYKEKQNYYRERSKESKQVWVSKAPTYNRTSIVKGRTYIKSLGGDKND